MWCSMKPFYLWNQADLSHFRLIHHVYMMTWTQTGPKADSDLTIFGSEFYSKQVIVKLSLIINLTVAVCPVLTWLFLAFVIARMNLSTCLLNEGALCPAELVASLWRTAETKYCLKNTMKFNFCLQRIRKVKLFLLLSPKFRVCACHNGINLFSNLSAETTTSPG